MFTVKNVPMTDVLIKPCEKQSAICATTHMLAIPKPYNEFKRKPKKHTGWISKYCNFELITRTNNKASPVNVCSMVFSRTNSTHKCGYLTCPFKATTYSNLTRESYIHLTA